MLQPHSLIVAYPVRGQLNPSIQFAGRLIRAGARVTFLTCVSTFRHRMISTSTPAQFPDGRLTLVSFSHGVEDAVMSTADDYQRQVAEMDRRGSETLREIIAATAGGDQPITCVVYTLLLTWPPKVARVFHLPSALLWVQPATVFDIYYFYFNGGHRNTIRNCGQSAAGSIEFPGLPTTFCRRDLPSIIVHPNPNNLMLQKFQEHIECLNQDTNPKILVNTFDALELNALNAVQNFKFVPVGPLIPSEVISDGKYDNQINHQGLENYNCMQWLDSKTEESVVYVSFETLVVLPKKQLEELARGLIEAGRPFLWVITDKPARNDNEREIDKIREFRQDLDKIGMIVRWCSQGEVLKHRSIGCFVTHCGWNSTLESLVVGVPVVAFPIWSDEMTNAKLLEDPWKTGLRVRENDEGAVERGEIRRCLEAVMVEKAAELKEKAKKWRDLAAEVVGDGGSLDKNVKVFVDELLSLGKH